MATPIITNLSTGIAIYRDRFCKVSIGQDNSVFPNKPIADYKSVAQHKAISDYHSVADYYAVSDDYAVSDYKTILTVVFRLTRTLESLCQTRTFDLRA